MTNNLRLYQGAVSMIRGARGYLRHAAMVAPRQGVCVEGSLFVSRAMVAAGISWELWLMRRQAMKIENHRRETLRSHQPPNDRSNDDY